MKMGAIAQRQAEFVFQYFLDRIHASDGRGNWYAPSLEATTCYDDGLDFVYAFQQAFPGRTPDQNHICASKRLRRLLKRLADENYLDRGRLGNHDRATPDEPRWQFVYQPPQWLANELKTGVLSPKAAAMAWGG